MNFASIMKWSYRIRAKFLFGWRLGTGVGPVARGDNPLTAHLALLSLSNGFDILKAKEGERILESRYLCVVVVEPISAYSAYGAKARMDRSRKDWQQETGKFYMERKVDWSCEAGFPAAIFEFCFNHSFI